MEPRKVIAVLGVGPGLGASIALRFARENYAVGLMARSRERLDPVREALERSGTRTLAIPMDSTDEASVQAGFRKLREELGAPEVFVYNAGSFLRAGILELTPKQFIQSWEVNCLGAFLGAQEALPAMMEHGRGTVLLTGATGSLRGSARFAALAVGKFGLRALAQSLAREFGSQGIHVAHVIIDGQIDTPRTRSRSMPERSDESYLSPDAIAEIYWQLHTQHPSAWTLELDLRPHLETF